MFPQRFMRHQRRCPGREVSTNRSPHFGFAHSRIRDRSSPENRSIASRAIVESACIAVAGECHVTYKSPGANRGDKSGAEATRLIVSISSASGVSFCLIACATLQIASRKESATSNSLGPTWILFICKEDSENQSATSEGWRNRSQYARFSVSPPVWVKSMHNLPAMKIKRAHSPRKIDLESGLIVTLTTPV